MNIPVHCSYIRRKDMDSVLNCLVTDSLRAGEYLDRFLKIAKERFLFEYGIALRSPLTAIQAAMRCFGLVAGDKVGLSALSPDYYAGALAAIGLEPVYLDVESSSASLGVRAMERARSEGVKSLIVYEVCGIMPDPAVIRDLGVPVLEDFSTAIGARAGETAAGDLGTLSMLGLEDGHYLTAAGGALLFAKERRDAQVLRNTAESVCRELIMSDMNAALGFSQLRDLERNMLRRAEIAAVIEQSLARSRKTPLSQATEGVRAYHGCPILLESSIKDVRAYARKKDVETAMTFEHTVFQAGFVPEGSCPVAASLALRCVLFPLHPRIGKSGTQQLSKVLATLP